VLNSTNKTLLFLATGVQGAVVGAAFAIGAFSVAGVPPAAGFLGKLAIFQVAVAEESAALLTLVVLGGALSFVYMMRIYQRTFWASAPSVAPSSWTMRAVVLSLGLVVIAVGLWPDPLLAVSRSAAAVLVRTS
jgi:multicomponent Na+:H+ antiporter subunit D